MRMRSDARWPGGSHASKAAGSATECVRGLHGGGSGRTCNTKTAPTTTRSDMTHQPGTESYMKPVDQGLCPCVRVARTATARSGPNSIECERQSKACALAWGAAQAQASEAACTAALRDMASSCV